MEYNDAPSGSVMLYNYKEPFMDFVGGYGYEGVLLFDAEEETVQCHFCGDWFTYLPNHLHREHAMSADIYKEKVGLARTSVLIGEKHRAKLIAKGLQKRLKNLSGVPKGGHVSDETKEKIRESLKSINRERQNLTGTCPDQLTERLRQKYHELGYTPGDGQIRGKDTFVRVFGSWKEACERAGVPYTPPGKAKHKRAYTSLVVKSEIILWIRDHLNGGEKPKQTDFAKANKLAKNTVWSAVKRMGGWKVLCHEALVTGEQYIKIRGYRYTKDELLKFLKDFKKHNDRNPAISDCKRGLLPHASRYIYHFGGWKQALKAASL